MVRLPGIWERLGGGVAIIRISALPRLRAALRASQSQAVLEMVLALHERPDAWARIDGFLTQSEGLVTSRLGGRFCLQFGGISVFARRLALQVVLRRFLYVSY